MCVCVCVCVCHIPLFLSHTHSALPGLQSQFYPGFLSPWAVFHLKWFYWRQVSVFFFCFFFFFPWKKGRKERQTEMEREREREYQPIASPQDTFSNPSNDVQGPVMVTRPANTPTNTHTHTHNPFLLYLGLQRCISCPLLAPHTHRTQKQKSILSTSQCHHNYSFETAIENKLHLHCVFIRLLWVSNAQRLGRPCLPRPSDPSL